MIRIISILIAGLLLIACKNESRNKNEFTKENIQQFDKSIKISYFNKSGKSFIEFIPLNLRIQFTTSNPSMKDNIVFSVAGAFTSKIFKPEGLTIEKVIINDKEVNRQLNGFVIIDSNCVKFYQFSDSLFSRVSNEAKNKKCSLFQQQLLVYNNKIINCTIFGNALNKRRALIERGKNEISVIQSMDDITIKDFQLALSELGIKNAIYLDMGSWSEGWLVDENGIKQKLGDNFGNTKNQTNWIVFEK